MRILYHGDVIMRCDTWLVENCFWCWGIFMLMISVASILINKLCMFSRKMQM